MGLGASSEFDLDRRKFFCFSGVLDLDLPEVTLACARCCGDRCRRTLLTDGLRRSGGGGGVGLGGWVWCGWFGWCGWGMARWDG